MKRTLTAVFAATAILSSSIVQAHVASAATYSMSKKDIYLNNKLVSTPDGIAANEPGTDQSTTYVPIWYVMQALKTLGITSTWDGSQWHMTLPSSMSPSVNLNALSPGTGSLRMYVNGTLVQDVSGIVAKDPESHVETTFMPIWYVMKVLNYVNVQSQWDGTNWYLTNSNESSTAGNTTGTGVTKLSVLEQFMNTLGITQNTSGADPYSDVSTADWGYVNAAIKKGIVSADSSTIFGANDSITIGAVDQMYWNYLGITSSDAKYQPGGTPYTWGQDIKLNRGINGDPMDVADVTQMTTNLNELKQGYYQDSSGVYHVVYPAADEWTNTFKGAVVPSDYQTTITTAYSTMNQITFTISGNDVILTMPTFASTSEYDIGADSDNGVEYSFNNGDSWTTAANGYDSQGTGATQTLTSSKVMIKAPTRIGIELDEYSKTANNGLAMLGITKTSSGVLVQRFNNG